MVTAANGEWRVANTNSFSRRLRARVLKMANGEWRMGRNLIRHSLFAIRISSAEHDLRQPGPAVGPAFITIMPGA
jgi:hypothetical protein